MHPRHPPVPGRTCGACSICCEIPPIDQEYFQKPAATRCPHLDPGQGCGIYSRRYPICREFDCGWLGMAEFGEEWRPDRSGLLLIRRKGPPPRLILSAFADPVAVLTAAPVLELVERCLRESMPVAIVVPTRPGFGSAAVALNEPLATLLRIGLFDGMKSAMAHMIQFARQTETEAEPLAD